MDYQARLQHHLFQYKEYHLGIRAKQYGSSLDALPANLKELNILSGCRRPFRHMSQVNPLLHLQADFHHLTSSQALCFNLFFPFLQQPDLWRHLLSVIDSDVEDVRRTAFDFSFGPGSAETFDFCLSSSSGRHLYFDVKLAENWFGPSFQSGICVETLTACLRHDIVGLVSGSLLKSPEVAGLIVLLKKLAYVAGIGDSRLICIYPWANLKLQQSMKTLQDSLYDSVRHKLRIVYLEDLIKQLLMAFRDKDSKINAHFENLRIKYVVS